MSARTERGDIYELSRRNTLLIGIAVAAVSVGVDTGPTMPTAA
jgi:hypothetical protein